MLGEKDLCLFFQTKNLSSIRLVGNHTTTTEFSTESRLWLLPPATCSMAGSISMHTEIRRYIETR